MVSLSLSLSLSFLSLLVPLGTCDSSIWPVTSCNWAKIHKNPWDHSVPEAFVSVQAYAISANLASIPSHGREGSPGSPGSPSQDRVPVGFPWWKLTAAPHFWIGTVPSYTLLYLRALIAITTSYTNSPFHDLTNWCGLQKYFFQMFLLHRAPPQRTARLWFGWASGFFPSSCDTTSSIVVWWDRRRWCSPSTLELNANTWPIMTLRFISIGVYQWFPPFEPICYIDGHS